MTRCTFYRSHLHYTIRHMITYPSHPPHVHRVTHIHSASTSSCSPSTNRDDHSSSSSSLHREKVNLTIDSTNKNMPNRKTEIQSKQQEKNQNDKKKQKNQIHLLNQNHKKIHHHSFSSSLSSPPITHSHTSDHHHKHQTQNKKHEPIDNSSDRASRRLTNQIKMRENPQQLCEWMEQNKNEKFDSYHIDAIMNGLIRMRKTKREYQMNWDQFPSTVQSILQDTIQSMIFDDLGGLSSVISNLATLQHPDKTFIRQLVIQANDQKYIKIGNVLDWTRIIYGMRIAGIDDLPSKHYFVERIFDILQRDEIVRQYLSRVPDPITSIVDRQGCESILRDESRFHIPHAPHHHHHHHHLSYHPQPHPHYHLVSHLNLIQASPYLRIVKVSAFSCHLSLNSNLKNRHSEMILSILYYVIVLQL